MILEFSGEVWHWRGPAPWYFVTVPEPDCRDLQAMVKFVTYGWGMIPVDVQLGKTVWQTSLFPKNGRFIVPIRASVRKAEHIHEGDVITLRLAVR